MLAVDELAANSIRHGGGRGILRIWAPTTRWCARSATRAASPTRSPAASARPSTQLSGRGLWIANAVCDLVQIRAGRRPRSHEALNFRPDRA